MTMYYAAFSLLRVSRLFKDPVQFIARLVSQILRATTVIVGGISGAWGSICLFNNYLPGSMIPKSRFFIGGMLGGFAAFLDQTPTGHANNMLVLRNSLDSLWKVGVKHRWWRGVNGGDVYVFVVALAAINMLYDVQREVFKQDRSMAVIRILRGDIEIGLKNKTEQEI